METLRQTMKKRNKNIKKKKDEDDGNTEINKEKWT